MSEDALRRNFGKAHALHVDALTRHLVECRRTCGGDLDLFLVLMIIGERTFTPRKAPSAMSHAEFVERSVDTLEPAAINLQSIADYSGIPRETVRRKIEALVARGWVRRDERRFVTVTDQAKDDLLGLTESAIRYLREIEAALAASQLD
ncbi:helix-turn-helix domain-containing protein [Novosphingobium sp.]|uniref:helix-turn-helix domain-containing protein n=1 Tax=Novosphingobium sp. TaxID=1874826 RepID=UPI0035AEFC71